MTLSFLNKSLSQCLQRCSIDSGRPRFACPFSLLVLTDLSVQSDARQSHLYRGLLYSV